MKHAAAGGLDPFPIGLLAWHFGPGEKHLARDREGDYLHRAAAAESAEQWEPAARLYRSARRGPARERSGPQPSRIGRSPHPHQCGRDDRRPGANPKTCWRRFEGEAEKGTVRKKGTGTFCAKHPEGRSGKRCLSPFSAPLIDQATDELARSSYYAAWIMRLEGAAADEWKPEAERARQQFRLLAERAEDGKSQDAALFKRNLEATIRLEQMDLNTLLAKPLPKKCCNCKSLSQRKTQAVPGPVQGRRQGRRQARHPQGHQATADRSGHQ